MVPNRTSTAPESHAACPDHSVAAGTRHTVLRRAPRENSVAEGELTEHLAPVPTEADVVFVRVDEGHYHRVWVTRDDGTTFGLRLDDPTARRAYEMRAALLERWAKTTGGEKMTLHWPLDQ